MYEATPANNKLQVFISYSRDDLGFSDQLDAALGLTGFGTIIDRRGISGGEEWKSRLGNLLRGADTVVFVTSPSSAQSKVCAWEVKEAIRLGKRIIPVLCRPLGDISPPKELADLNYIYFYDEPKTPGSGFGSGLVKLVTALNTDLEWLREHTRYLQRATEWDMGGQPANRLLSGADILAAKEWATRRPKDAPEPTELQLEFIRASEAEENRRQSAEAQRFRELTELQLEREQAVKEREKAFVQKEAAQRRVVRRTVIGSVIAAIFAIAAGWFGITADKQKEKAQHALDDLQLEQRQRINQAFQMGWRSLAGLTERSGHEYYKTCGTIEAAKGVRRIYCEVANVISLQTLATLSGIDIFKSGPHVRSNEQGKVYQYNLRSHEIGRYNPAFIAWLGEYAVPAIDNETFRRSTIDLFREHVQEIALEYHRAYLTLFDPAKRLDRLDVTEKFVQELSHYTAEMEHLRRNAGSNWRVWSTSPSYKLETNLRVFDDKASGTYESHVAMAFWVRRSLDGTHRAIFDILRRILIAYDAIPESDTPLKLDDL